MARILPLRHFLILLSSYIHVYSVTMPYFSYLHKREVLQHEYSKPSMLPSPHFRWVVNSRDLSPEQVAPEGGGGTASLKVGTHWQTTAPAFWHCLPLNLFLPPPIFEGHRPPPPKIKHSLYKIIYKCDPKSSKWLSI